MISKIPFWFIASLAIAASDSLFAEEIFTEDFKKGSASWEFTDESAWRVVEVKGNTALEIFGKSDYQPPHRSPYNMALYKYASLSDFELTARVQTLQTSRGHRDMCVFFGYQDSAHFYYVHLGQKTDDHANQVFIVNGADRIKISEKTSAGTPWVDGKWHNVKVVREAKSGLIEIYFDDMKTPAMVAHDKTFGAGKIGLGTFDDIGYWDDVKVTGQRAPMPGAANPASLKFDKWTPEFQVPDPVAISIDGKGTAYVTQTRRRKANDLDIRKNMDWIDSELSFTSVAEKSAYYQEQFTPENSEANKERVADYNNDGVHDIKDLTELTEVIYQIVDTDDDGKADKIKNWADGFNTPVTGIAAGVLYHEGKVYTTIAPDVWSLEDTDDDGRADERDVVAHGFGVHLAYGGHDMHGLTVGPDGRIYWSIGDKGVSVTSKEGRIFKYPNQGAVLRCEPDGSNFEVFAHGLRNVQEPKFDQYGNLFGVDNDADFAGEMERFVYIIEGMDAGWRSNWQYRGDAYNPWTAERMWEPGNEKTPAHIVPPIRNYQNGPAGFAYNPGTALSPEWQGYFFLNSAPSGQQYAFQVEPVGAGFKMINETRIGNGIPLVGSAWGPDGALYSVDWGGGYPLNEKGAVWKIDVPEYSDSTERKEVSQLLAQDEFKNAADLLGHADMRVRMKAQFQLAKAGDAETLLAAKGEMAAIHGVWGYGQIARAGKATGVEPLMAIATDQENPIELRVQAVRTITGDFVEANGSKLADLLKESSPRLQLHTALALGKHGSDSETKAILAWLAEVPADDYNLRHAGTMALAGTTSPEQLASLSSDESETVRLAAVVALRKLSHPGVAQFLGDTSTMVAVAAASAIHDDWMIPEAMPALAAALGERSEEAFLLRSLNANLRLGDAESAARVAAYASTEKSDAALATLSAWTEPPVLDRVVGRHRPIEKRDLSIVPTALKPHLPDLLSTENPATLQAATMKLASDLGIAIDPTTLANVAASDKIDESLRLEALRSLASQKSSNLATVVEEMLKGEKSVLLRSEALEILGTLSPAAAVAKVAQVLEKSEAIVEKQRAIATLAAIDLDAARELLGKYTAKIETAAKPLRLDLALAAGTAPTEIPLDYTLEGGDAARGEEIFRNHLAAQCIRCHKVADGKGSTIGPNLKSIGAKKDRAYILQSLAEPQAVIASGYGAISITLKNGDTVAGQFRSEKNGVVEIRDPEGKVTKVKDADIESRSPVISTMPPMALLLKRAELRDVIEYLTTLKAK